FIFFKMQKFSAMKDPHQIMEKQRKLQLLESDRAAQCEGFQWSIEKNAESIQQLRQQNKRLFKRLSEAIAVRVIDEAFNKRGVEKEAYRNMSGQDALMIQDQKVLSKMKRLNAQKHVTQTKQQQLAELEREYQTVMLCLQMLRAQENRLEKIQFKCKEAENITVNYQRVKRHLQEESLTFQSILDSLEAEILKYREELNKMQIMNNEAQLSKKAVKVTCRVSTFKVGGGRRPPSTYISSVKTGMMMMMVMQPDDMISEALQSEPIVERKEALSTFEDAYRCIKEATGVTNAQEILERFTVQKETHQHLLKLKEDNKKMLQQLREQKELLTKELEDVPRVVEECVEWKQRLQAQQQRHDASKQHLNQMQKSLSTVRAGVEHLAARLHHIELVNRSLVVCHVSCPRSRSRPFAILLDRGGNPRVGRRSCTDTGARTSLALHLLLSPDRYQEAEEGDVLTREELKHQSQLIVESKSKKKPWKNEKF
uniref:Outer dynein arm docking complex subunit 3 n=1 Tax=Takifugu rubripes TaxID=31033 RepID=A0A3B5K6K5_TAKRU